MSSSSRARRVDAFAAATLLGAALTVAHAQPAERFPGIGRAATAKELAA